MNRRGAPLFCSASFCHLAGPALHPPASARPEPRPRRCPPVRCRPRRRPGPAGPCRPPRCRRHAGPPSAMGRPPRQASREISRFRVPLPFAPSRLPFFSGPRRVPRAKKPPAPPPPVPLAEAALWSAPAYKPAVNRPSYGDAGQTTRIVNYPTHREQPREPGKQSRASTPDVSSARAPREPLQREKKTHRTASRERRAGREREQQRGPP